MIEEEIVTEEELVEGFERLFIWLLEKGCIQDKLFGHLRFCITELEESLEV